MLIRYDRLLSCFSVFVLTNSHAHSYFSLIFIQMIYRKCIFCVGGVSSRNEICWKESSSSGEGRVHSILPNVGKCDMT